MSAVLLTVIVLVTAMFVHEAGHALAAWVARVRVREVMFGLGPILAAARVGGVRVSLRLLPLGAGVDVDDNAYERAPAWKKAVLLLSGPAGNFLGCALALGWLGWLWSNGHALATALFAAEGTARVVTATVSVLVGGSADVVGPVGLARVVGNLGPGSLETGLLVFACVSAGLGVFNLLPVAPLDGGRIVVELLGPRLSPIGRRRLEAAGAVALGAVAAVVFLADIVGLLR